MQQEYGDAIQVIFVESQNSGYQESVGFAMGYGWMGTNAIWTSDYLFSTGSNGLPNFALLSPSGEVVLKGNSNAMHGQIEEAIEEMIKNGGAAPEEAPSAVKKGYAEFLEGKWAKAHDRLSKAAEKAKTDEERKYAEDGIKALEDRLKSQVKRVTWLAENGYPERAEELAESLQKGSKGADALVEQTTALSEVLASEDFQKELAAAKDLNKAESKLFEDAKDAKAADKVLEVVEDHLGTKVALRAQELAEFAKAVPGRK